MGLGVWGDDPRPFSYGTKGQLVPLPSLVFKQVSFSLLFFFKYFWPCTIRTKFCVYQAQFIPTMIAEFSIILV